MRSPPPRYGPLHGTEQHSFHGESEAQQALALSRLPDYVAKDIVSTPSRHSHRNVRGDREQRLHSLIRRYTNQIQHGCRNRNCAVRTCLSYRKRNTKGVLRPYSDLSARSLAANLVDECFKAGRDPTAGLCPNEPVVPWYKYPDEVRQRASRLQHANKEQSIIRHRRRVSSPSGGKRSLTCPQSPSTQSHQENDVYSVNTETPVSHDANLSPGDLLSVSSHQGGISSSGDYALISHDPAAAEHSRSRNPQVRDSSTPSKCEDAATSPSKKDWASFVQCLWDAAPLRTLSKALPRTAIPRSTVPLLAASEDDAREWHLRKAQDGLYWKYDKSPVKPRSPHGAYGFQPVTLESLKTVDGSLSVDSAPLADPPSSFNIAFCGLTLRRLSWRTLKWFSSIWDQPSEPPSTAFEVFVKQSFFCSLSDPYRLHKSAESWSRAVEPKPEVGVSSPQDGSHSTGGEDEAQLAGASSKHLYHATSALGIPRLDVERVFAAFDTIQMVEGSTNGLYGALHTMLQSCYTIMEPARLRKTKHHQQLALQKFKGSGGGLRHLPPENPSATSMGIPKLIAADLFALVLLAALAPLFSCELHDAGFEPLVMGRVQYIRNRGLVYPPSTQFANTAEEEQDWHQLGVCQLLIDLVDHFEDWHLLRLMTSLANCLSHHIATEETAKARYPNQKPKRSTIDTVFDSICRGLPAIPSEGICAQIGTRSLIGLGIKELARSILLKEWDREPIIRRTSPVGGALELLAATFRRDSDFYLQHTLYYMPFIAHACDTMEMPNQWLSFRPNSQQVHILHYSFLFDPATLVKYFRSINVTAMRRSHENASAVAGNARQYLGTSTIPVYGAREVLDSIRPQMAKYFVLTVRRTQALEDSIDQIWRREKQEILRPLKVRLGKDEGEDGLDHGGVQQEFFKLVFAEAFRTDYGMFDVDSSTYMTWFQPGTVEQLYKFEVIGILMSLAVYNAVTLPITMPLAFYRKLLGLKVKKLEHIKDGWPDLAKGLQALLDYDGDVAEHIARTYDFSYEFAGMTTTLNMRSPGREEAWPVSDRGSRKGKEKVKSATFELPPQLDPIPPSASPNPEPFPNLSRTSSLRGIATPVSMESEDVEAPVVTNESRQQYVKDYVFWLTDKSVRPQYKAFAKGFFTCVDQAALSMFTPEALRSVIEGHRKIDLDDLQSTATYEEYEKDSDYVKDFWEVVKSLKPEQHRKLLEFVTASDRVPVSGMDNVQFIVQKNGEEDERLPSSSTCYGRLLLPKYSSRQILEEKLTKALENSMGFGML